MSDESTQAPVNSGAFSFAPLVTILKTELDIIALESERVVRNLLIFVLFGLVLGLLTLSLWFMALTQFVLWTRTFTLSLSQAIGLAMVANLIGIWWLVRRCRYYSRFLNFPATRRSIAILLQTNRE